ncbi:MAG TPA: MerR family transcriptional regulator, partial [Aggregatilineales bacterium]|nr:MerR family transcriptional regulator [Aggregatilineales bacterium]
QVGLLKPVEIDRLTGYRYYSASQLPRLHRILALKGLGFSLEQIGAVLDEGLTPEQMRGMLRLRQAQIRQQLNDAQSQLVEVEMRLQQIEREQALTAHDVMLKQVEAQLVASVRAILPVYNEITPLYDEVYDALGMCASECGPTMAIWYDEEYREHDVDGAAAFTLRSQVPEHGRMKVHELPAATVAATVHQGSYNTLIDAHEAILKWIEANGYRPAGPSREIYLYNTMPIDHDDPSYITEVQFPVEKLVAAQS